MYIIEKVSGITFRKDVEHPVLKITRLSPLGAPRSPTPPYPSPPLATRHSRGPSHVSSFGSWRGRMKRKKSKCSLAVALVVSSNLMAKIICPTKRKKFRKKKKLKKKNLHM